MLKLLDVLKIGFICLYSITATSIYFLEIHLTNEVKHALVLLTHTAAIPIIVVVWNTQWAAWTIIIGIVMSIVSHTSIILDWHKERIVPLDIGFANLTLMLVSILVIFDKVPLWSIPCLITLTVLITVFYDFYILYGISSGLFTFANFIYIVYRTIEPTSKRDKQFLVISLIIGIGGLISFQIHSSHDDSFYYIFHSIWHVCSYGSIYFALRSIRPDIDNKIRRPRLTFTNEFIFGELAYK